MTERITGKLLKDTENGTEFACTENDNADYPDDSVVLETVDIRYVYPFEYVQNQIEQGNMEVVRDLHSKEFPYKKREVVHSKLS